MANIPITKTELVWPGKYDEGGVLREAPRINLPFETAELFGPEAEWRNKLIWGDNRLVMGSLLEKFAASIDLVYIDPPFATGADFSIGQQQVAYRDTWKVGMGAYLAMIAERLRLIRDLLSPAGSLFLHCDWHVSHLLRAIGDEVFGAENFLNEIVWYYYNKFQGNVKRFASNHDVVLWYRKGASYQFNQQLEKRAEGKVKQLVRLWDKEKAAIVNAKDANGRVMYRETDERRVDDVWRISMLQPADRTENCGFPTQKPEALLRRILQTASSEGDLVADFFCGSGTMLSVAEKLKRRWIGCDLGRWGIHTTRKRLLDIQQCRPFAVLNLGKEERRYWQGTNFRVLDDYVAFLRKLYGAEHAMVRVGAVDTAMTTHEIAAAVEECAKLGQTELHILSWEWAWDSDDCCDRMVALAAKQGVTLCLLQIPLEVMEQQAAEKGNVRFFPPGRLEAEVQQPGPLTACVALRSFAIRNPELNPEDVRSDWSDYIDYWAVDWDFRDGAFMHGWAAYRTRRETKLPLISGLHAYENDGRRRILVRVIDIFGNETRQGFDVDIQAP
jgi:adenine-specific DNA-methyltransferase